MPKGRLHLHAIQLGGGEVARSYIDNVFFVRDVSERISIYTTKDSFVSNSCERDVCFCLFCVLLFVWEFTTNKFALSSEVIRNTLRHLSLSLSKINRQRWECKEKSCLDESCLLIYQHYKHILQERGHFLRDIDSEDHKTDMRSRFLWLSFALCCKRFMLSPLMLRKVVLIHLN